MEVKLASKRRLRRNACIGKVAYPSPAAAMGHVSRLREKDRNIHCFKCGFCGHFHIGHYNLNQYLWGKPRKGEE